ncbi:hypothetical protein GGR56DRAFT_651004 [Xylariaceae sp. FL0804]|nr:hypothetical protein GGR56DRAFT_651004 [Xylariaceae sp. FL0804]
MTAMSQPSQTQESQEDGPIETPQPSAAATTTTTTTTTTATTATTPPAPSATPSVPPPTQAGEPRQASTPSAGGRQSTAPSSDRPQSPTIPPPIKAEPRAVSVWTSQDGQPLPHAQQSQARPPSQDGQPLPHAQPSQARPPSQVGPLSQHAPQLAIADQQSQTGTVQQTADGQVRHIGGRRPGRPRGSLNKPAAPRHDQTQSWRAGTKVEPSQNHEEAPLWPAQQQHPSGDLPFPRPEQILASQQHFDFQRIHTPHSPPSQSRLSNDHAATPSGHTAQSQQRSSHAPTPSITPDDPPTPSNPNMAYWQDRARNSYYDILAELDPYRATPKEFIHLLVNAAVRDWRIAKGINKLNEDRLRDASTWQPVRPPHLQGAPSPQVAGGPGPIQTPQPRQAAWTVYAAPGQAAWTPQALPQLAPRPNQALPQGQTAGAPQALPQGQGAWHPQPVEGGQAQVARITSGLPPPLNRTSPAQPGSEFSQARPNGPINLISHPIQAERQVSQPVQSQPVQPQVPTGGSRIPFHTSTGPNPSDSGVEGEDGTPEPREMACNFTWVVDRAETSLGWTGRWDTTSQIRQVTMGYEVALKLGKLLKKMNGMMDKYVTFANRVHILCVMKEIMMVVLETDSTVGKECRECAREYDVNFVQAVKKLSPKQRNKLKELEGGTWLQELNDLIDEADRQNMFSYLKHALVLLDQP